MCLSFESGKVARGWRKGRWLAIIERSGLYLAIASFEEDGVCVFVL